ncbi:MAG: metal-sulfur cluster assembly factor [Betaproteobacteria bacterium]|nr:MAG: metal-sulfur cluster assembly factor [Betaproteobacteria bacterium]
MADATAGDPVPDASAAWDALREVLDPEIGENLVDIGLVYRVACAPGLVEVDLTLTTPACPAAGSIAEQAEHAIRSHCPEVREVRVTVVFDPPWTPERMSEQVRQRFGW